MMMPWQLHTVVLLMLVLHSAMMISMVTCRTVEVDILTPTSWTPGGDTRSSSKAAYLSQLSEYLFDHSPETFFRFVDHLCSSSSSSSSSLNTTTVADGDEDDWQPSIFDAAAALTPSALHSLMHTMTSVGHYAPTIQFFHSLMTNHLQQLLTINSSNSSSNTVLSPPCGPGQPFIVLPHDNSVVCSPQDLLQRLSDAVDADDDSDDDTTIISGDDDVKEWEHVYVAGNGLDPAAFQRRKRRQAILYGAIGTLTSCTLHRELVQLVEAGTISTYRFRHSLPDTNGGREALPGIGVRTALHGFGVHLDIKNMEYKNVDDDKGKTFSSSSATGEGDDGEGDVEEVYDFSGTEEVLGVNFPALYKNAPGLGRELVMLRDELLRVDAEEGGGALGDKGQMKVGG